MLLFKKILLCISW